MATMLPLAVDHRVPISFSATSGPLQGSAAAPADPDATEAEQLELRPKTPAMNSLAHSIGSTQRPAPGSPSRRVPRPSASDGRSLERRMHDSVKSAGRNAIVKQFAFELERLLDEQAATLPLLSTSPEWALKNLHRQYLAIRTAAELLEQPHLAAVAERAEVLICMLSRKHVQYKQSHLEAFTNALGFLREIAGQITNHGSERSQFTTVCIALSLFAAVEPSSRAYTPELTCLRRALGEASARGE